MREEDLTKLTERIIACAYRVAGELKYGYLEKVYENAMRIELERSGLKVDQQRQLSVMYQGVEVGHFIADLVVEDVILIEMKSAKDIDDAHKAQCINYLQTTGLPLCLLLNFGPSVKVKRIRNFKSNLLTLNPHSRSV